MKFEKLLEKYRKVCNERDELAERLADQTDRLNDANRHHEQTRNRIQDAVRLLLPQPKEADQVNQAGPRMGSPKREPGFVSVTCPFCNSRFHQPIGEVNIRGATTITCPSCAKTFTV